MARRPIRALRTTMIGALTLAVLQACGDAPLATRQPKLPTDASRSGGPLIPTSTTLSVTPSTIVTGQSAVFAMSLTDLSTGGNVTNGASLDLYFGACGSGTLLSLIAPVSSTANTSYTTAPMTPAQSGTYTACYNGDTTWEPSSATAVLTVNPAATSLTLASPTTPSAGSPIPLMAGIAVVAPGSGMPTGNYAIYEFTGTESCAAPGSATPLAQGAVGPGFTPSITLNTAGNHTVTLCYLGDANYLVSETTLTLSVGLEATTTTVNAFPNPSVSGQLVQYSASTTQTQPQNIQVTQGTITFRQDNCAGPALSGAIALTGFGGIAEAFIAHQAAQGSAAVVVACYSGSSTYAASEASHTQAVNKGSLQLNVTEGSGAGQSSYGTSVTFQASVSVLSPAVGTPGGSVTFHDGGSCIAPGALIGTATLTAGAGSVSTTLLAPGPHTIVACYGGDANFYAVGASTPHNVHLAQLAIALTSSANNAQLRYGDNLTLTATVSATAGSVSLAGRVVTFLVGTCDFGVVPPNALVIGTATVGAGNTAQIVTDTLPAGVHTLAACVQGDANAAGAGTLLTQTIDMALTSLVASSSPSPSNAGASLTLTASVSVTSGGGTPVGSVAFYRNSTCTGTPMLGSATIVAGTASISGVFPALTVGSNPMCAVFVSGNGNHYVSASTWTHTVNPVITTSSVSLTVTPGAVQYSDRVSLSATVTPATAGSETQAGTVQFRVNGSNVGSPVAVAGGVATLADVAINLPGGNPGPTNYPVEAIFTSSNPAFTGGSATGSVMTSREDAVLGYDATNPAAIAIPTPGGTANVSLLVSVVERNTSGVEPSGAGAAPGDITQAGVTVVLQSIASGGNTPMTCTPGAPSAGPYPTRTFTCTASNVAPNTFEVQVNVTGSYYLATPLTNVVTVYDPSLGFITGGGWFHWPGTSERTNFGFTVKYNKNGTSLQGSLLVVRHKADGTTQRFKTNALSSLVQSPLNSWPGTATFSGKGGFIETGWASAVQSNFTAYVEDGNNPGTGPDKFWLNVAGYAPLRLATPAATNAVTLQGGNIQVPHTRASK